MNVRAFLAGAVLVTGTLVASVSQASVLKFTIDWAGGPIETFKLDTTAGEIDGFGTPPYVLFPLIGDNLGYDGIFFGDASVSGFFGTGPVISNIVATVYYDFASPAFYSGSGLTIDAYPGETLTATNGSVVHISGVPETSTWAMMLIGFASAGFLAYRRTTAPAAA